MSEWNPKRGHFWVVFDESNGDSQTKRYLWWFDTKKAALAHIKHVSNLKHGALLSNPFQVFLPEDYSRE